MGSMVVVVFGPGLEVRVTIGGVGPVFGIGLLAQRGLDEPLRLAVGSRRIRPGAAMLDMHRRTSMAKPMRAVTGSVVGQQRPHLDAMQSEKLPRLIEERDARLCLLIG